MRCPRGGNRRWIVRAGTGLEKTAAHGAQRKPGLAFASRRDHIHPGQLTPAQQAANVAPWLVECKPGPV